MSAWPIDRKTHSRSAVRRGSSFFNNPIGKKPCLGPTSMGILFGVVVVVFSHASNELEAALPLMLHTAGDFFACRHAFERRHQLREELGRTARRN